MLEAIKQMGNRCKTVLRLRQCPGHAIGPVTVITIPVNTTTALPNASQGILLASITTDFGPDSREMYAHSHVHIQIAEPIETAEAHRVPPFYQPF